MIDFKNVSKSFATQMLLQNVSFRIHPGERVGVVGPNGAGKSTLFQMVTGETSIDSGTISIPNNVRMACLHQHVLSGDVLNETLLNYVSDALDELRTIRASIQKIESDPEYLQSPIGLKQLGELQHSWESLGGYRMEVDAKKALAGLGFHPEDEHRLLKTFSGGWQMRAALAKTLIADPDLLLLDEPSNYLDVPAIEWLDKFLIGFKGTLLLISHDRFLLRTLTNIILEINNCQATRYQGSYDYYVNERDQRATIASNQFKNAEKQKEKIEAFINRFRAQATKASAVQSAIKMLDKMNADAPPPPPDKLAYAATLKLPDPPHCGEHILTLQNLGFYYKEARWIFRNLDIEVNKGDKIAIVGYNGMGKTTLLKNIAGILTPKEGKITMGHKVIVGYQAQEFADILPPEKSVYDVARAALPPEASTANLRSILGAFGFTGDDADKQVKVLSGGEKIRLCFARIFVNPPNLLILDEPTTHLDIRARETLQNAITNYKGTVLMVSHDIEFLRYTANHIIDVAESGIKRYYGNYAHYLAKKQADLAPKNMINEDSFREESDPNSVNSKERRRQRAELRQSISKEKQKLEKKIAQLEAQIESSETEHAAILESLATPDAKIDFSQVSKREKELRAHINTLTLDWEYASETYLELVRSLSD